MKTKVVYVLTSNSTDCYLEQLMVSAYSLRLHNPDIKIMLVVDQETLKSLTGKRNAIYEYVSEITSVDVPAEYNKKQRSRFLKTNLRNLVEGDYLFIDTDTIICGDLSEIDLFKFSIGAVLDKHIQIKDHPFRKAIVKYANLFDWNIPSQDNYFNSGIMYVKDDSVAHNVYKSWYEFWKKGLLEHDIEIDQPSLAKANEINNYPIKELSGIYNCQIIENGIKYLVNAKIIHYFASVMGGRYECPYVFGNRKIYEEVRMKGISNEIKELLNNPKSAFSSKTMIISGILCELYNRPIEAISRRISLKIPSLNSLLDKIINKV